MIDSIQLPGYSLVEQLYRGNRSTVWRALREDDGKLVVLKAQSRGMQNPVAREYALLKGLDAPHVIRVYDLLNRGEINLDDLVR